MTTSNGLVGAVENEIMANSLTASNQSSPHQNMTAGLISNSSFAFMMALYSAIAPRAKNDAIRTERKEIFP